MSVRRQTNVTLPLETAEKMDRFARIFHRGEFAPVARVLIEEALEHIRSESDYLEALKRIAETPQPASKSEGTYGKLKRK